MATSVRSDSFTFYALTAISFLESTVGNYVENMAPYFKNNPAICRWLETVWLPEEAEHGHLAREYVEAIWPEFDLERGYNAFFQQYWPRCDHNLLRPSPALEALARCVTEAEATMIYRCIASYASDPEIKALMKKLSSDEVRHYTYFRDVFDTYDATENNSFLRKARTIIARSQLVRDEDIALAFLPLNDAWRGTIPFVPLSYPQFLAKAGMVARHHFPFEAAKRMLFRPLATGSKVEDLAFNLMAWLVRRQYSIRGKIALRSDC
jgi:hypothetical protein